jgi:hypothetical protein
MIFIAGAAGVLASKNGKMAALIDNKIITDARHGPGSSHQLRNPKSAIKLGSVV